MKLQRLEYYLYSQQINKKFPHTLTITVHKHTFLITFFIEHNKRRFTVIVCALAMERLVKHLFESVIPQC